MSGIKQFIYDQQMDLEREIHDHEMNPDPGLEHISDVMNNIANIQEFKMRAEMQPQDAWQSSAPPEDCPF